METIDASRISGVMSRIFFSDTVFIYMMQAIKILRNHLKAASDCLLLCWRAKNKFVSAEGHVLLVPKSLLLLMLQLCSLGHACW